MIDPRGMTRPRTVASATLLAILMLAAFTLPVVAADEEQKAHTWDQETIDIASSIPIQDGGRIKPLSTFARFRLIAMCGKSTLKDPEYGRMKPMHWLLNVLFFTDEARKYKVFVVQSSDVLDAIGLADTVRKKRDSYSYDDLEPGRAKLFKLAGEYGRIQPKNRTTVERQIYNLAFNIREFERLAGSLRFAHRHPDLKASPSLAALFPRPEDQRFSALLLKATAVRKLTESLQRPDASRPDEERRAELAAVTKVLREAEGSLGMSNMLAIFPPSVSQKEHSEWMAPGELIRSAFTAGPSVAPQIALLGALEELVHLRGDGNAFKQRLLSLRDGVRELAEKRGEYGNVELEVSFYRVGYFTWSLVLFIISFVLVALCWILPRSRWASLATSVPLVIGLGYLSIGITLRCIIRARPPVSTLYETFLFITAVAVLSALLIELMNRRRIALGLAAILGMVGMFLANRYEIKEAVDTMPSLGAVLDTNFWLATHVTTIAIGYSAGLLAAAIAHVYIFGKLFGLRKNDSQFYRSIGRVLYGTVIYCLFFSVLGTLLGGVWANESWGRFWGWDPKENGALMICLWTLAMVHAHRGGYIRDLGIAISSVFCGIIVAFSWWGVNLLNVGLHTYGFTHGILVSLLIFIGLEMVVIALGGVAWLMGLGSTEAVEQ